MHHPGGSGPCLLCGGWLHSCQTGPRPAEPPGPQHGHLLWSMAGLWLWKQLGIV